MLSFFLQFKPLYLIYKILDIHTLDYSDDVIVCPFLLAEAWGMVGQRHRTL